MRLADEKNKVEEISVTTRLGLEDTMWYVEKASPGFFSIAVSGPEDVYIAGAIQYDLTEKKPFPFPGRQVFENESFSDDDRATFWQYQLKEEWLYMVSGDVTHKCRIEERTEEEMVLLEDLTEQYRMEYPDGGVEKVHYKTRWKRFHYK